ncbi:hypothetical protein CC1G_15573 [Coprinopsis cinerea okayama7|uniref:BAH domain-containing protein n=1 Tax=Coprinopsis cinerea (strain Okayama-7 / 130 / ATCC MYA-4618 / FGSC 9003) TaxID=240176 RepID=D6RNB4_COPC7|nr:hypothetical protein CC1G_15573 [Coprinopsis cinerea okayama7\|eukprot:XP_002911030.1 hypothetical protein CC1G_15573 [Coprinopsis cinerea okayama7\
MAPRSRGKAKEKKGRGSLMVEKVPTDDEWARMAKFGSFTVSDDDDVLHQFPRGSTATVLPSHCSPGEDTPSHDYWVARIRDIRARVDEVGENEVWVRVQWYYGPSDVAGVLKSFNTKPCGKYERILSDHFDYVAPEAFNEVVNVHQLRDDDPEQPYIDRDSFYSRYEIERQARRLKPKPGTNSCVCAKPYNPDDPSEASLMHFCPRPRCRKWYHRTCLVKQGSRETCTARSRSLRLISTSPDDDQPMSLSERIPMPPSKRTRHSHGGNGTTKSDDVDPTVASALDQVPDGLVLVSEQPIVRGALYERGGVSGNVRAVVNARRLVYEALAGKTTPSNWEELVLGAPGSESSSTLDDTVVKIKGKRTNPSLLCPECSSAI